MSTPGSKWEQFAREDAEFFILTTVDDDRREGESREDAFFRTGEAAVQGILERAQPYLSQRGTAVEIGCGVGRLSLAMAAHFESVRAVDVSPSMLEKLQVFATERNRLNVQGFQPHDNWDEADSIDLAYSWLVFQHIPDAAILEDYLRRIARALKPDGCACLQYDTRPQNLPYRLRSSLPDFLLPRTQRKGIRRVRRSRQWLLDVAEGAGLKLVAEHEPLSATHTFVWRRRS